jgi:hypothetical protein
VSPSTTDLGLVGPGVPCPRRTPLPLRVLVLALACLAAAGAARGEGGFRAGYELYLGGFWVGELQSEVSLDGDGYVARFALESRGVAAWLADVRSLVEAEGTIEDGRLVPRHYRADTRRNREERSTRLSFDRDGRVVQLEVRPAPEPVPRELQRAPDPVSALLEIIRTVLAPEGEAAHTVTSFGGVRAVRLGVTCPRHEPVPLVEGVDLPGQALRCDIEAEQLAGPPPDYGAGLSIEELATLWLVPLEQGGVLVRARMRSRLGAVMVRINRFEALPAGTAR